MPLLLSDRAALVSPLPLVTSAESRVRGITVGATTHVRVRSGVYAPRVRYAKLKPWKRYAVRVHAFARAHPDVPLCLESAAVVWGLPGFNETHDIHVYDAARTRSRRFGDVSVHTSADLRTIERHSGLLVTSLLDTVNDLSRVLPPAKALAVVDAAISRAQGGWLNLPQLRAHAAAQATSRGSRQQQWLWDRADGRSESPAESVSRAVIEWCGFEEPELQRTFHYEYEADRVDFYFPSVGAIGEADGWGKYSLEDPAKATARLKEEKRREDRLRRHGHPFGRWELADVWRVRPLRRVLTAAGVPFVRLPQPAMLATLNHNPREVPPAPQELPPDPRDVPPNSEKPDPA